MLTTTCPTCHGSGVDDVRYTTIYTVILGEVADDPTTVYYACQDCKGTGKVETETSIKETP
jgi:DnaJ-class molecular chaperone